MQVTKRGAIVFIKSTKSVFNKLYKISEYHKTVSYYLYDGTLLKTDCFNIQYSLVHHKVSLAVLKQDEIYVISEVVNNNNLFNLFEAK